MALAKIKKLVYVKNTPVLKQIVFYKCYNNKYLLFITFVKLVTK
jgi:hypothetical protein